MSCGANSKKIHAKRKKTSNTRPRPKHVVDQGYREGMETVGLIQMDQTLDLTVATLVQR
jgi:hypothetical protein